MTQQDRAFWVECGERRGGKNRMDDLRSFIDIRRPDSEPELFAIALALRHIRLLIQHGRSDIRHPGDDSALHPRHLEAFLARTVLCYYS